MPTLITQDEFETELLLNPNLTMAIPAYATVLVAQIPKKKFKQLTMRNEEVAPPSPKTKTIQVQGHNCGSAQVHSYLRKINAKAHENKKETKATNPKRRLENQNLLPFTMGKMTAKRVFNWPRLCTSKN
jgi:hypothetical protein